ncbi:hypothetical protein FEM48_Zijuj04G0064900 [Ziziphus jujuba var. spinosa]|uniref:Uncharacterized protein n=1 Tax=Ziziphus jujuba var. spinosa TaxID=714518 RepID=A0A978VIB9_ZIZJJ|nr:hypothetical protein FEM48_Zijuj04G0064900 [Ziziphus jujuba var. spinosa]
MYVTRPLSMYRKSPHTLATKPEVPNSGHLVLTDEEADAQDILCWASCGICKRKKVKKLPFPQDKILSVIYTSEYHETSITKVWFLPVPYQPLSSNCYYVIRAKGRHKGKACTSSREGDIITCCFRDILRDKKPKPLNHRNIYQQFKIHRHQSGGFFAKSVAPDGVPPKFLRRKGWKVRCSRTSHGSRLNEALGIDTSLREKLPDFNFPIFNVQFPSVIVGKWYCPFGFVREKAGVKRQMKKTILYSLTLEQWWEEIYSCGNVNYGGNTVTVNEYVQREVSLVGGFEAVKDDRNGRGAFTWFKVYNPYGRKGVVSVGLSHEVVENMKWVLEEHGWVNGEEREVKVERVEEFRSENGWRKFGCYVLVESFVLRRLDGSLVLKCSFRHTDKIRCKWE